MRAARPGWRAFILLALIGGPLTPATAVDLGAPSPPDRARARQLLAEAAQAASRIVDAGPQAGVWVEIAGAQARAGDRAAAEALARRVGNPGWRAVADGLAAAGDVAHAVDAAGRIRPSGAVEQWVADVVGATGRDEALLRVVHRCAARRDFVGARFVLQKIAEPTARAEAEALVGEARAGAGHRQTAARHFRRAEWAAERLRAAPFGDRRRAQAYRAIGRAHGRLGETRVAARIFDRALGAALAIGQEVPRDRILGGLAVDRAQAGDVAGAVRTLEAMRDIRPALAGWAAVARAQAERGEHAAARATAEKQGGGIEAIGVWVELGQAYRARGDVARAAEAFARAGTLADGRPDETHVTWFTLRDEALLEVARQQARAGDREGALETGARVTRRRSHDDALIRDAVLEGWAAWQAAAGDVEGALGTVAATAEYPPDPEVWRAIGRAAGRQGAVEAVLARLPPAVDATGRALGLLGLAEGLLERAERRPRQPA
jgi:tetratricopeptide (TPR) repeat protein